MKTSELTGAALDWAVAKIQGAVQVSEGEHAGLLHWPSPKFGPQPAWSLRAPTYSTDWAQGGPVIEREGIAFARYEYENADDQRWRADYLDGGSYFSSLDLIFSGPTPLIAAMRCFVASKLGDEVDVPEKLT